MHVSDPLGMLSEVWQSQERSWWNPFVFEVLLKGKFEIQLALVSFSN